MTKQRQMACEEVKLLRNSESSQIVDLEIRLEAALAEADRLRAENERLNKLVHWGVDLCESRNAT